MCKPLYIRIPMEKLPSVKKLWQELNDAATAKPLDDERFNELRRLVIEWKTLHKTKGVFKQVMGLICKIKEIGKEYGYPSYDNLVYRDGGKVGALDLFGNKMTEPIYDEFRFTFDDCFLSNERRFVARKGAKWGIVNENGEEICPFEYDFIARVPDAFSEYLIEKDGKQGILNFRNILIPCEMDSIHIPGYKPEPFFFQKDGKWGWHWGAAEKDEFYENHHEPFYDEIFYMNESEWKEINDDDEEFFEARIGDEVHYILEWTIK